MKTKELKKIAEYELVSLLDTLKKSDTWMTFFAIVAFIFALFSQYIFVIVIMFLLIILNAKRNYERGVVQAYFRKKYSIPTRGEIRQMKNRKMSGQMEEKGVDDVQNSEK